MMQKSRPWVFVWLIGFLAAQLLSACNLPARQAPTASGVDLIYTAAAQTVAAQVTQPALASNTPIQATFAPFATTPAPLITLMSPTYAPPTAIPIPSTPTPLPCDWVKFISDITIPDDSLIEPGKTFVKTWRLQNAGSCTWNASYAMVVDGENLLNAPLAVPITSGTVPPGVNIDVSVTLTAPTLAGTYRGNFKLVNAAGQKFGLGADHSKPFWAQIKVSVPTGIVVDFLSGAPQAQWLSGKPNSLDTALAFGGSDNDVNGVAKIKEGVKLENGATSGKVLLTFPKNIDKGAIAGTYPAYLVQAGDHLRARLGFIANPNGSCGVGKATFQISYVEAGVSHLLGEWVEACDGKLTAVNIDLTSLKGKTIQIVLLVKTDDTFQDDWAIWSSPRIER